jgi:hypothetical protein
MVAIVRAPESATPEKEDERELHVVAFYEDLGAGERAKELIDRIHSRVPRDTHTTPGLWRFDILQHDHLTESAEADAAIAAVIIVAAQGKRPLPTRLLACIDKALAQKTSDRVGLVAILDGLDQIANETLPVYRQLQAICRNAKIRFFSLPARNLVAPAMYDGFAFGANRLPDNSLLIEIRSHRGWGIND